MIYDITGLEILQVYISDLNKDRSDESKLHLLLAKVRSECLLNYICIPLRKNCKLVTERRNRGQSLRFKGVSRGQNCHKKLCRKILNLASARTYSKNNKKINVLTEYPLILIKDCTNFVYNQKFGQRAQSANQGTVNELK